MNALQYIEFWTELVIIDLIFDNLIAIKLTIELILRFWRELS